MSDTSNQINPLLDRERIRGASRMIPEGTEAAKVTAQQIQDVAADVEAFCRANKISRKAIARSAGYSPGVVSDFLGGKYAGDNGKVAIDLENWLVAEEQRRSRPQTTQFVWTNVALTIKSVANYAIDKCAISMIYGPDSAGIGKTTSLLAIHQELGPRRSSLITIDKVDANPTGLLIKLCKGMHLQDSGSCRQKFGRLVDRLKGRSHLLMIDQIHNLREAKDDKPFYILTDLWDATKDSAGQLWCGTADLVAYLQRQQKHDESLAQIRRRIFPRVDLMDSVKDGGSGEPLVSVDQIREMFAKNKLKLTSAAARFLCELANTPDSGGIGVCVQLIEYATATARGKLTVIDVDALKQALQLGMTTATAELIVNRVEETTLRIAKNA
jgi:hypothetical protein